MLARIRERSKLGNKRNRVALNVVQNLSFEACMRIKRASDIVLDDTVTGSYHLVGLESLAMGIPTIAYIDARMERLLKDLTGAPDIPWVNVRIEELEKTVAALIADPDLRRAIGKASHAWMQTYYREEVLIQHFVKAYEDLLANPQSFSRKRFNPDEKKAYWFVRGAYDVHYESRKHRIQRGSCPLGEASYMDHRGGDLHCSPFKSQVWIAEKRYPFGSWLFENRYRRIDARCKLFHEMRRKVLLEKYKQALPYAEGARVVDLASGTGYGTAFLKQEGRARSVVGVENDVLAVAYAQELYAVHGVCYLEKDVLHSSLQASSFDLVVAIDLIEWVDCDASLMRECVRLLAPGGRCVISAGDFWNKESEGFYKRRYTPQGFANLLSDGFQSVCLYRQLGPESRSPGVFIPENNTYAVLKEGESLIAVCSL
jgi:SAM-dependent methyltransferase